MSQTKDDAEYLADEYEKDDIEVNMDGDFPKNVTSSSDSKDTEKREIQGIDWDITGIAREKYRGYRIEQYRNYENIPGSGENSEKECMVTKKEGRYYDFRHNSRSVKSTILHFQLRNLVWASSNHGVYLLSHSSIIHWSSLTSKQTEVLNVAGHVAPSESHPGSQSEGFTGTQVTTLAVKDNLLVAGGFQGELICKNLNRPGVAFCARATSSNENVIINAVEIYGATHFAVNMLLHTGESTSSPGVDVADANSYWGNGATHFMASSNDCGVRVFDMEKYQLTKQFQFPWPVNHTSLSPDGKQLAIVGDNPDALLVDSRDGKTIASLSGHLDYSFASAWHPNGNTVATGNQDKTCRVWDIRNPSKSLAVLKGSLGAIRSIRYSPDGEYMAMAEPADFVHVYDVKNGYEVEQEIDFFGEISSVSFSPDTESLFIGVWDRTYGSLLEYGRRRN